MDAKEDPVIEPSRYLSRADADFIARARTAVPALVQEVKDLRERLFAPRIGRKNNDHHR